MKLLLLILLLTSCTKLTPRFPMVPIKESYQVNVVGLEFCAESWGKAVGYLYSEGIHVVQHHRARSTFVCLPYPTGILHVLSRFLSPFATPTGYSVGNFAWVKTGGSLDGESKLIIHELMHLLKNEPHRWSGVMVPFTNLMVLMRGI